MTGDDGRPAAPRLEAKVRWASWWTYVGSVAALGVLETVSADPELLTPLPDVVEVPLVALLPTLITLFVGWRTRHTPRPDLPMSKR